MQHVPTSPAGTSFNYGWCPFYRELPRIHPDAISPDATSASDRSKQIRIYRGSTSRKEDLGWNVSHLPRRVLLVLRPTSRATSPLLSSAHGSFRTTPSTLPPILRSPTFTSTLSAEDLRIKIWMSGYLLIKIFFIFNRIEIRIFFIWTQPYGHTKQIIIHANK